MHPAQSENVVLDCLKINRRIVGVVSIQKGSKVLGSSDFSTGEADGEAIGVGIEVVKDESEIGGLILEVDSTEGAACKNEWENAGEGLVFEVECCLVSGGRGEGNEDEMVDVVRERS